MCTLCSWALRTYEVLPPALGNSIIQQHKSQGIAGQVAHTPENTEGTISKKQNPFGNKPKW